ncbi:hypothetical protein DVH24_035526 [Malus domestica]|uniref:F-box associated beta-propeller type 1 domain-containing protein n=1 Tax=Malus domestica TaxID=3750 RepID=A0A498JAC9_MALDO|nr:hypothetical protein DVH24_035526 [Malus domestica]
MDKGQQISGTILGVRVETSSDSETTESAASSSCSCSSCSWKEMGAELANLVKYKHIDIILRLPATSVLRSVSKLLKNMVDNPAFVTMYMQRLLTATNNAAEVPQLMLLVKSPLPGCFFNFKPLCSLDYNVNENALKLRNHGIASEILTNHTNRYNVHFVFCNLVWFKDIKYGGRCFLLNPLKGEVLMLPTSNVQVPASPSYHRGHAFFDWYAMGFDNITNTYKILRVCGKPFPKNLVAQILVLGTSTWREISSVPPCEGLSHKNVSAYGDMHWRSSIGFLIRPYEAMDAWPLDAWSDMHIDIWVLKNFNNKEWVKQYCKNTELARYLRCCECPMDRCGEWEHGIFFKELISCRKPQNNSTAFFLDLRGSTVSTKLVECPMLVQNWTIISYTGSLISLNNYGNLRGKQLGLAPKLRKSHLNLAGVNPPNDKGM